MPNPLELGVENEPFVQLTYDSQNDAELVFRRVLKTLGFPITIDDIYGENGIIESSVVSYSESTKKEIGELWNEVIATRKGDAAYMASVGAPIFLMEEAQSGQADREGRTRANRSPRLPERALDECFVAAYEHVDGYHDKTQFGQDFVPEIDAHYATMKDKGILPIGPEGLAILLYQAVQERANSAEA